jgi:hypothetical protein
MRLQEFFAYANEREETRLRKEAGFPFPWTKDPIIREYKFTNVNRFNDKTSRELYRTTYAPHRSADMQSILLNCAVSRYFGTWEFSKAVGWLDYKTYDSDALLGIAKRRIENGYRVFTGAYIITNGGISAPKEEVVVGTYLDALWKAIPELVEIAQKTRSWQRLAIAMMKVNGFGGSGFMTKETLLDTMFTDFWPKSIGVPNTPLNSVPIDYWSWTPIGPGGRRGVARVLGYDDVDVAGSRRIRGNEEECHETLMKIYYAQEEHWKFFKENKLAPTDIQFVLCEFDKYERTRLGQGKPRSRYRRS